MKIILKNQKGIALALVIGAVAVLGLLAYLGSSVYTSIMGGMQRTNMVVQSSQLLTQSAYILATETTKNASGIPVATTLLTDSSGPVGGGFIPTTSASPKVDSFGTKLGYCTNTATTQADPVFVIISAGPNKKFSTNCADALIGKFSDDDNIVVKSVANILQGVGGTVYFGDPVTNVAALGTLTSPKIGEMRVVLSDGSAWVNKTGVAGSSNWLQIGGSASLAGKIIIPLYLDSNSNNPIACPSTWSDLGIGQIGTFYRRSCLPPPTQVCSNLILESTTTPAACPTDWTDLGNSAVGTGSKRACIKCS